MRLVPALLALAATLAAAPAGAFEANLRLGVSSPLHFLVDPGPSAGLTLALPLRSRIQLVGTGDVATHALKYSEARIDAVTATLGLEAGLDLAPIVPTVSIGPSYQYARTRQTGDGSGSFGGFIAIGVRATVAEHLRLGFQARYLTAAFGGDSFPAYATFVLEVGWVG
jgi:hypothetical protein